MATKSEAYRLFGGKLVTILWITLVWLLISLYQYFDRYAILIQNNCIDENYPHFEFFQSILVSLLLGSVFIGSAIVFLWEKWLRKMVFYRAISAIVIWYTILYFLITAVSIVMYDGPDSPLQGKPFEEGLASALFDVLLLPNYLFWLCVMFITIVFLLVRDKFGPSIFLSFLSGKYFRPRREERIFMFMDLKSSTTIAESLGEEQYFNFLNDTFKVASPGIVSTKGEIYQYVGDEIVVSWPMTQGLASDNCVRCYLEMMARIRQSQYRFEKDYGVLPHFKAGLHAGFVVAGEMGVIKREIVYTGDVLNTAARIQAKCNEMKVDLLISSHLVAALQHAGSEIDFENLGALSLKGKSQQVEVATVNNRD